MGEVYRARDNRLHRDVAIKVLPEGLALDADQRARFEREAQAVAALSHPNVLAIFDTGDHQGRLYAVTELLEGATLRDHLRTGPIPVRTAIDYAIQVARGLAAAHDKQLVHRDLKPENIFILSDGRVKILDFGLARQMALTSGAEETVEALTGAGAVLGTVGYMAPEQVRGEVVDARADLFAFGAVLYEMLTGRRAFRRDTSAETMTAILREEPPTLSESGIDLPLPLDRIVRHCLEKAPQRRSGRCCGGSRRGRSGTRDSIARAIHRSLPRVDSRRLCRRRRAHLLCARRTPGGHLGGGYFDEPGVW